MRDASIKLGQHLINKGSFVLDMDGTILDLGFDDFLWNEALPTHCADLWGCSAADARQEVAARLASARGTLAWYCFDHWTRELGIDIAALEHSHRARIRFLPGARYFLSYARRIGAPLTLATNAHPKSLALKSAQTGLGRYFDRMCSSHRYRAPKESPAFWEGFLKETGIVPESACFVDDNPAVLRAAEAAGIRLVIGIERPVHEGSSVPHNGVPTITNLGELCAPGCPLP